MSIRLMKRYSSRVINPNRCPCPLVNRSYATRRIDEPLRILFCGSDEFSIASLRALHAEKQRDDNLISSLDVVCRPGKPVGRGLKKIRDVPIAGIANELSLPLHQIDTFTKWEPPRPQGLPINLIIAVSFGLFVPPRILKGALYGGLNVHPSILPDFHGPAPLHHTLLSKSERTGVTIQTLHPEHFDRGVIIAQTLLPGFEHRCRTVQELLAVTAPKGAEMLVQSIREGVFLPTFDKDGGTLRHHQTAHARAAPKITSSDRHINWNAWTAEEILLRNRLLGPLWNRIISTGPTQTRERRVIWSSGFSLSTVIPAIPLSVGQPFITESDSLPATKMILKTCDGQILETDSIKMDGGDQEDPARALGRAGIDYERKGNVMMT